MASFIGTPGNDILNGTPGDDWLDGLGGNDVLFGNGGLDGLSGGAGDDSLYGGAEDDWLNGGPGNDLLDGGPTGQFVDTADYSDSPTGVNVNLADGFAYDDGWGGIDTLVGIEAVTGSSFNDILIGDSGYNWFRPGTGNDYVDAGGGFDVLFYESLSSGGVIINLDAGTAQGLDGLGNVVFTDTVLNFEAAHGSYFDDVITLTTGSGYGFGRAGNDTIYGLSGNDSLIGGSGNDILDGGADGDTAEYYDAGFDGAGPAFQGIVVDLAAGTAIDGWGDTDTLISIENISGSQFADQISGDGIGNGLLGHDGNDVIQGRGGFDWLAGGSGADVLDGGADRDWASYYDDGSDGAGAAFQGVDVNLTTGIAIDGWGDTDTLISIEDVQGSQFADQITGDNGSNSLMGLAGNDSLIGGGGDDWFRGGSGDDLLDGGAGYDIAGYRDDEANDIPTVNGAIVAHLGAVSTVIDRWGNTDTLNSVERVDGSNGNDIMSSDAGFSGSFGIFTEFQGMAGDDTISGNGLTRISYVSSPDGIIANLSAASFTFSDPSTTTLGAATVLDGWGGTDSIGSGIFSINASANADYLLGSSGDDEFRARGGNDWVDGGAGFDTVRYTSAPGSVHVNLADGFTYNDGWGGVDTLFNIEGARGGNNGDTLIGDAGRNILRGEGGADLLQGGGGDDDLYGGGGNDVIEGGDGVNYMQGGSGDDILTGGSGTGDYIYAGGNGEGGFDYDIVTFKDAVGSVTATLGALATVSGAGVGTDTLSEIESVRGSQFNDVFNVDVSYQSSFSNTVDIEGLGGDDVITGNGATRLRFREAEAGVTVDLALGVSYGSDGIDSANVGWDTFTGVSRVWGSQHDDILLGSAADEQFRGDLGNDLIDGGGGTDRIDFVSYDNGVFVDLAAGVSYDGDGGIDSLISIENITGSRNDDDLNGDSGSNVIRGSGGNDLIDARTGDDEVTGDGGNDTIIDAGAVVEVNSGGDGHHHHGHHHGKGHDKGKGKGHDKHDHDDDGHHHYGHHHGEGHDKGKGKGHDKHDDGDGTVVVVESDDDSYSGGVGDDLFVFGEYNGHDTITDFSAGAGSEDVIDVSALNLGGLADLLALADDNGGTTDTTITFSEEGSVTLIGVQVADLHQDDFII